MSAPTTHPMAEPWLDWQRATTDNLPREGTPVLVCDERREIGMAWRWGNRWDGDDPTVHLSKVTHWARVPMPEDE